MKKIIIAIIIFILLGVGYFLFSQFPRLNLKQTDQKQETAPVSSEKIPFDTNDNLDQAIEDLYQIE